MPEDPMSLFGSSKHQKKEIKKGVDKEKESEAKPLSEGEVLQEIGPDTMDMLLSIQQKKEELDNKLLEIIKKGEALPSNIQDLMKNLSSWPEQGREEILMKANLIIEKINEALGTTSIQPIDKKYLKGEKRTHKAQKIRGKKNWISMQ